MDTWPRSNLKPCYAWTRKVSVDSPWGEVLESNMVIGWDRDDSWTATEITRIPWRNCHTLPHPATISAAVYGRWLECHFRHSPSLWLCFAASNSIAGFNNHMWRLSAVWFKVYSCPAGSLDDWGPQGFASKTSHPCCQGSSANVSASRRWWSGDRVGFLWNGVRPNPQLNHYPC